MDGLANSFDCASSSKSNPSKMQGDTTLKIEKSSSEINITCEPDWLRSTAVEEVERRIDPYSSIVKSEYEFQSSFLDKDVGDSDEELLVGDEFDNSMDLFNRCPPNELEEKDDNLVPSNALYISKKKLNAMRKRDRSLHLDSYVIRPCPYCNIEFDSYTSWKRHLNTVHDHKTRIKRHFIIFDDGKTQCMDCNAFLNLNLDPIEKHSLKHLPYQNVYKCKICSQIRFREFAIFEHIERIHFDIVGGLLSADILKRCEACPYCDKYVGTQQMMSKHIQKEHSGIYEQKLWYACPVCGDQFARETSRKVHLNIVHDFQSLKGMSIELTDEKETDSLGKKYRCLKCNEPVEGRLIHLTLHALLHQEHKLFKCRFCDYGDNSKWRVIKHSCSGLLEEIKTNLHIIETKKESAENTQASERNRTNNLLVCPKCGSSFEELSLWEEHLRMEHNFDNAQALGFERIKQEDGTIVNRCTVCDKKYVRITFRNLRLHAFMHMPYKLRKCRLCEKPLGTLVTCACHTEKSVIILFVCPKCGIEFNSSWNWYRHIEQTHHLNQPSELSFSYLCSKENETSAYHCTTCGHIVNITESQYKDVMFEHAIKHMPHKCYKCSRCGDASNSKEIMKVHIKNCEINLDQITVEEKANCNRIAKCQCHICNHLEDSEENIRSHLSNVHIFEVDSNHTYTWFCTECEFKYETEEEISQHVLSIHLKTRPVQSKLKYLSFICPLCGAAFQMKPEWESHLKSLHDLNTDEGMKVKDFGKSFECLQCFKEFKKYCNRKLSHYLLHCPVKAFKCIMCGADFRSLAIAQTHVIACSKKQKGLGNAKRIIFPDDAEEIGELFDEPLRNKKKKTKKIEKSKIQTQEDEPGYDPLQIDEANVQTFSPTRMAINTVKSTSWNRYCQHITYACPECNTQFGTADEWHMHISSNHDFFTEERLNIGLSEDGKRICKECGVKVYGSTLHAQRHKLTHMPYQAFICKICQHRSKTNNVLIYHIERRHFTQGEFKCPVCQTIFETSYDCVEHTRREHTDSEWPDRACRICIKVFSSVLNLKEHMKTHEIDREIFECDICKRKYFSSFERKKHIKQSHPLEYKSMSEESEREAKKAQTKKKAKRHQKSKIDHVPTVDCLSSKNNQKLPKIKEEIKPISGELEEQSNNTWYNMNTSLQIKSEPMSDDELAKEINWPSIKTASHFSKMSEVRVRIKRDPVVEEAALALLATESKVQNTSYVSMAASSAKSSRWNKYRQFTIFACPECNMKFETAEEWDLHIISNHDFFTETGLNIALLEDGQRVCKECGVRVYGNIVHAQCHKLTHMPYRAFICKICQHTAKTKTVLTYHIERRHFTLGEFQCAFCPKIFKTSYEYSEHTKSDHKDTELSVDVCDNVCRICSKEFCSILSLKKHLKIHKINREKFECEICKRKYLAFYERKRHLKLAHPLEYMSMLERGELQMIVKSPQPVKRKKSYKKKKDEHGCESSSNSDQKKLSEGKLVNNNTAHDNHELRQNKAQFDSILESVDCSIEIKNEPGCDVEVKVEVEESDEPLFKIEPLSDDDMLLL